MSRQPTKTCNISHRHGWQVNGLFVTEKALQMIFGAPGRDRDRYRSYLCIEVRKRLNKDYAGTDYRVPDYIDFDDLTITVVDTIPQSLHVRRPRAVLPMPRQAEGECDECAECENGSHERCGRDCPQAPSWSFRR